MVGDKEKITLENGDTNCWICVCKNTPNSAGFYPCDSEGNYVEPTIGSVWINLYRCDSCRRIINMNTLEVVGRVKIMKFNTLYRYLRSIKKMTKATAISNLDNEKLQLDFGDLVEARYLGW